MIPGLKPLPKPTIQTKLLEQQAEQQMQSLSPDSPTFFEDQRERAIEWARELINNPDQWVILDTETTGLGSDDQVIQVALLDGAGNVLIDNQLIRPTCEISPEAQGVHGITLESLRDAPTFNEFAGKLAELLEGKIVIIYNADFDVRMLSQSFKIADGIEDSWFLFLTNCAMKQYARFVGDWNYARNSFRWHRLPAGTHDALGDCKAVYELIKIMTVWC